jgi:hypothetical protein
MKIPLSFSANKDRITVEATIIYANRAVFPVLFIVDTGSMDTFVDKGIVSRARISVPSELYRSVRMGGTTISLSKLGKVTMVFENDVHERTRLDFDEMKVADNAKQTSIYSGVSILGMDFLISKRAKLIIDPSKSEACIET